MSIFDQFSKVTKDFGNKAQEMTKDIKGKLGLKSSRPFLV